MKMMVNFSSSFVTFVFFVVSFSSLFAAEQANPRIVETGPSEKLILPLPNATRAVANPPTIIPWPKRKTPIPPAGLGVTRFADDLANPPRMHGRPHADALVVESLR